MLSIENNTIVYNHLFCQQCGVCQPICPQQAISYSLKENGLSQIAINHDKCILCKKCINICPANTKLSYDNYFEKLLHNKYYLGYNKNELIRKESSSGGCCKTLIIEGLKQRIVDGVYSLKNIDHYPYAEGEFYTQNNIPSYNDIPNSVYHSVMAGKEIHKITKCKRLMVIGTSCQLKAIEKAIKGKYEELIKVCIFCKQQKTLNSTKFMAKIAGTRINDKFAFKAQYRGDGWPGIVRIGTSNLPWDKAALLPFGRRLWTVPGCNICGDPFGLEANADITVMDPWNIRQPNGLGETLITVHSEKGAKIIDSIKQLQLESYKYQDILPALGIKDIKRKQELTFFFKGENCSTKILIAGKAEILQRRFLIHIAEKLPKLPLIFYRIIFRLPDLRNIILK